MKPMLPTALLCVPGAQSQSEERSLQPGRQDRQSVSHVKERACQPPLWHGNGNEGRILVMSAQLQVLYPELVK